MEVVLSSYSEFWELNSGLGFRGKYFSPVSCFAGSESMLVIIEGNYAHHCVTNGSLLVKIYTLVYKM